MFLNKKYIVPDNIEIIFDDNMYKIITTKDLLPNEKIFDSQGYLIDNNIITQFYNIQIYNKTKLETITVNTIDHAIYINKDKYLHIIDSFMNHSCNPNTYIITKPINMNNKTIKYESIYAKFFIKKGTELTYNYLLFEYDSHYNTFECNCNSNNCCKIYKGFKYLDKKIQLKLLANLNSYVLDEYLNDKLNN